ncbi:16S rRNA (adenine(1518)-N(6)/adenine(1519)-N(6))-dimethyltransferase RsmA [Psychroflexus sp. MBR-150]|jgi:16S rRNA (adenine1518-N6/adenine1519-N6)-dimethyltransferase
MANTKNHFQKLSQPVRPKKFFGQHFLKDETIAQKIADALNYEAFDKLIEIGPGTGMLTKFLLKKPVELFAFEIDKDSIAFLNEHILNPLENQSRFKIIDQDFLKADLETILDDDSFGIIGNFPYNISSQILFKTIELRNVVPEFAGMFQKEVAKRICAESGNKTYGILSVLTQAFYETKYLFTVKPQVFNPPPKVDSGVIKLTRRENYKLDCDEKLFFKVVKTAFQQRRKTLRNSLKTFNLSDNLKSDLIFAQRPERLSYQDFVDLTQKIAKDAV